MDETKYILYLDNLQRLILGELVSESAVMAKVKNPIILHVQTTPANAQGPGGINIQFFPLMFKEFLADKDQATTWNVPLGSISRCDDIVLDARLVSQYKHIFSPVKNAMNISNMPTGMPPPVSQGNNNVIKLFDE